MLGIDLAIVSGIVGVVGAVAGGGLWLGKLHGSVNTVNGRVNEVDRVNNERYDRIEKSLTRIETKIDELECNPRHEHDGHDGHEAP